MFAVAAAPRSQKKTARVARSHVIIAELNKFQALSCETRGEPLRSCVWARPGMDSEGEAIVLDKDDGGLLESKNMSVVYDEDNVKCSLKIEVVTEEHLGTWSCTLIDQTGGFFSGKIEHETIDSGCIAKKRSQLAVSAEFQTK